MSSGPSEPPGSPHNIGKQTLPKVPCCDVSVHRPQREDFVSFQSINRMASDLTARRKAKTVSSFFKILEENNVQRGAISSQTIIRVKYQSFQTSSVSESLLPILSFLKPMVDIWSSEMKKTKKEKNTIW